MEVPNIKVHPTYEENVKCNHEETPTIININDAGPSNMNTQFLETSEKHESQVESFESSRKAAKSHVNLDNELTLKLLNLVKDNYSKLQNKVTKKKHIWIAIWGELKLMNRSLALEQVEKKLKNIVQGYKKFIENMNTTGKGRMKKPEFFDLIEEIIGESQVIRPKFVSNMGLAEEEGVLPESPLTCTTQETEEELLLTLNTDNSTVERSRVQKREKRIRPPTRSEAVEESIRLLVEQNKKALAIDEQKVKIAEEQLKTHLQFEEKKLRILQQIEEEKLRLQREFLQENLAAYKERTNLVAGKILLIEERFKALEAKIDNR